MDSYTVAIIVCLCTSALASIVSDLDTSEHFLKALLGSHPGEGHVEQVPVHYPPVPADHTTLAHTPQVSVLSDSPLEHPVAAPAYSDPTPDHAVPPTYLDPLPTLAVTAPTYSDLNAAQAVPITYPIGKGRTPKVPKAPKAPKAPKTHKAPKAPKAHRTPKAPKAPKAPKGSKRHKSKGQMVPLVYNPPLQSSTDSPYSATAPIYTEAIPVSSYPLPIPESQVSYSAPESETLPVYTAPAPETAPAILALSPEPAPLYTASTPAMASTYSTQAAPVYAVLSLGTAPVPSAPSPTLAPVYSTAALSLIPAPSPIPQLPPVYETSLPASTPAYGAVALQDSIQVFAAPNAESAPIYTAPTMLSKPYAASVPEARPCTGLKMLVLMCYDERNSAP